MCAVLRLDLLQDLEKLSDEELDTLQCIASVFAGEAGGGGVGSRCVRTKVG